MEDLVDTLTRGNPTEVKVVLTSVVLALAVQQLILIAIGYGKVRPPFLAARPASRVHRASGDVIVVLVVVIALFCWAAFGFEDDGGAHAVTGAALLVVLALKIVVIRWWTAASRVLPLLGATVFVLLAVTFATSAGDFLAET